MINKDHPGYFFKNLEEGQDIPIDGVPQYMKRCWEQICEDKSVNMPVQRILVAKFRCEEIKNEIFESVEEQLDAVKEGARTSTQINKKMGGQFDNIMKTTIGYYTR